jgi:hypothetical protein
MAEWLEVTLIVVGWFIVAIPVALFIGCLIKLGEDREGPDA